MRVWHLCTGPGNSGSDVRYMCEHVAVIKHDGLPRFVPTFGEHAKKKKKNKNDNFLNYKKFPCGKMQWHYLRLQQTRSSGYTLHV